MGNSALTKGHLSEKRLSLEEREAMKKFAEEEVHVLKETFKGLANSKNGYTVDKETFLKCFRMPGLLGERLFEVIDKDGSGSIAFNEFVHGLAILFRGTRKEKMKFIFDLYDLSETGSISRHELTTMLNQFPQSALNLLQTPEDPNARPSFPGKKKEITMDDIDSLVNSAFPNPKSKDRLTFDQFCEWCDHTPGITTFLMSVLPYEEQGPSVVAPLDGKSSLPTELDGDFTIRKRRNSLKVLQGGRSSTRASVPVSLSSSPCHISLFKTRQLLIEAKETCANLQLPQVTNKIQIAIDELELSLLKMGSDSSISSITSSNSSHMGGTISTERCPAGKASLMTHTTGGLASMEYADELSGDLWKKGSRLRQMIKRHYVLSGNFLYYYATPEDIAPRGVSFMCGCYVESLNTSSSYNSNSHGITSSSTNGGSGSSGSSSHPPPPPPPPSQNHHAFYGFEIIPEQGNNREKRIIYAKTEEERNKWVTALRKATDKVSIEEYYEIGPQLGKGRFSRVCEAIQKQTNMKHACKIIDKGKLVATEKELLRTEIAILKLVRHPNIIRLHDVYEDKQNIYIVTELVSGGELFNRIVGRSRYTEAEARLVMQPLLESVAYLHKLGIVHRDIKPENILCGEKLNDLKIADFGLSKLVYPQEIMKMPCGTLNYVAPEVLSLVGYGKEADIWSVGVIMYLLLRGELPFHGKTKNEIISKTLHAEINVEIDSSWQNISPAGKALLKALLTKDTSKRITAKEAIQHEWFTSKTTSNSNNSNSTGTVLQRGT